MAEEDTTTPTAPVNFDPDQIAALLQRLGVQPPTAPAVPTEGGPGTHGVAGFLSDVGTALGGGPTGLLGLSPDEQAAAGRHALLNFGINMLAASGKSYEPKDFGTVLARGLQGAQQAQEESENRAYVGRGAQNALQQQAFQNRLAEIKAALPLLTQQYNLQLADAQRRSALGGGKPGTSIAEAAKPFVYPDLPKDITPEEDQIVRTVWGEANGQPLEGQQGVAAVIKNRMASSGQGAQDVIFAPNQFEPWNTARRAQLEKLSPNDPQYQAILKNVVRPVMAGDVKDPTGGATHFYAPALMAQRGQGGGPDWASGQQPSAVIGGHNFYKLPYGGQQTATGGAATPPPYKVAGAIQPPPAASTAAPAAPDLVGPRPLPTIGPGSPVVTPQSLANTPVRTAAVTSPPAASPPSAAAAAPPAAPEGNYLDPDKPFIYTPGPIPPGVVPPRDLSPEQKATYAANLADINRQIKVTADPAQLATLQEKRRAVLEDQQKAADTQQKQSQDAENKLRQDELASQRAMHEEAVKQKNALALKAVENQNAIAQNQQATINANRLKVAEPIQQKAEAAESMLRNAQNLELFAKSQGGPNALWDTDAGKRLSNWIVSTAPDSALGKAAAARQSWDIMVNGMFNDVHVPGMGAQSDRETNLLMSQWGSASQTPLDRMTQLAIIRKNAEARIQDGVDIGKLMEDPTSKISSIHDIRKTRQIFDRPPVMTMPKTPKEVNEVLSYNDTHPMGEPYVTWAPKADGSRVLKWARNTGDTQKPVELLPNVDVRQ